MALAECVREGAVCLELEERERDDVLRHLLEKLAEAGAVPPGLTEQAFEALRAREALGSTAIGRGVAVPHARMEGLGGIVLAFGYSAEGVPFNALDGQPVHQVFLIMGLPGEADEYMDVMQRISRLVQDEDFLRFVRRVRSTEELIDLLEEMDD